MHIKKTKTSNGNIYYLCKSFRNPRTKKVSSKIIERIGSDEEIKKKIKKGESVQKWLKDYVAKKNKQEANNTTINIKLNKNSHIKNIHQKPYNAGFLCIRYICREIKLDKILKNIEGTSKLKLNLYDIVSSMIYNRIINHYDYQNTYDFSQSFIEKPSFTQSQLFRSIDVLSKASSQILYNLHKNYADSKKTSSMLYFDKQNYIFNIKHQSSHVEKSLNEKELLVDYEIIMNNEGIPIAYNLPRKFINSPQEDYKKLQKTIGETGKNSDVVIFNEISNSHLSQKLSKIFKHCSFVNNQKIELLNDKVKDWITDNSEWKMINSNKTFELNKVKDEMLSSITSFSKKQHLNNSFFYKSKIIKITDQETGETEEKTLIAFFSFELQQISEENRRNRILNIKNTIDKSIVEKYTNDNEILKHLKTKYSKIILPKINNDDELKTYYKFNDELFTKQSKYDGFYTLIADNTNINVEEVIKIHSSRWQIVAPFQKINAEFMQTPEYIKQEYAVNAHLLVSTLTLIVWRELLNRLKNQSYGWDVANKLREMNFLQLPGIGWIPAFVYDKLMRNIVEVCNLDFNHQLITDEEMSTIIKSIKN